MILNIILGLSCWFVGAENLRACLIVTREWVTRPPDSVPRGTLMMAVIWPITTILMALAGCRLFGWL